MSYNKDASQSPKVPGSGYGAELAVDGNTATCMRTKVIGENSPDKTAWWKVDLGGVYNIYSVNILFRNYDGYGIAVKIIIKTSIFHFIMYMFKKLDKLLLYKALQCYTAIISNRDIHEPTMVIHMIDLLITRKKKLSKLSLPLCWLHVHITCSFRYWLSAYNSISLFIVNK